MAGLGQRTRGAIQENLGMDAEARQSQSVFDPETLKAAGADTQGSRKNPLREGEDPPVNASTVQPVVQRGGDDSESHLELGDPPPSREDDAPDTKSDKTIPPIQRPDPGGELIPRNPGPERGEEP
jgi:hypothetical protein